MSIVVSSAFYSSAEKYRMFDKILQWRGICKEIKHEHELLGELLDKWGLTK